MNDLLAKLEAAIKRAELLALRASTRHAGSDYRGVALNVEHDGPYDHGLPGEEWIGVFGQILEPVGIHAVNARDSLVATVGHPDVAGHVVHNDPKRVLRRVARDRKLLARHYEIYRDVGWMEDGDERMAELPVCGHCVPKHSWFKTRADVPLYPCADVRDLAEDYEIQVEG